VKINRSLKLNAAPALAAARSFFNCALAILVRKMSSMVDQEIPSSPLPHETHGREGEMVEFGNSLQNKLFNLYDGLINFNHGSFGTVPKPVLDMHFRYMLEQESCPESWFRVTYYQYIDRSRMLLAKLIKAQEQDVVLVENASYAVNAILRSFDFKVSQILVTCDYFDNLAEFSLSLCLCRHSFRYLIRKETLSCCSVQPTAWLLTH
jgi:hypothetical protein